MVGASARLGDVCEVTRGRTITRKSAIAGNVPVVAGGLSSPYSHNEANSPANTVTVSGSGANAGFVNFWDVPIYASDCSTVAPKDPERLLPVFVYRFLQSQQDHIYKELKRGAAQPHVYPKDLAELVIPHPPLPEQERIVAILDEAFAAIATATANAEKNLANARELFESQLEQAFTGDGVGEGWEFVALGKFCDLYQPKTISKKDLVEDDPYVVFGANGPIGHYHSFNHADPQVVVTCRGATCGSVSKTPPSCWITGNAMVIAPRQSCLDLNFLYYLLRGIDFSSVITGAAQPQITRTSLAPLEVAYPTSISEQQRIVAILDEASASSATLARIGEQKLTHLTNLKQSLLHKAFIGELTADSKAADRSLSEAGV